MWPSYHNGLIVTQMEREEFTTHPIGPNDPPTADNLLWITYNFGQTGPVCIRLISDALICGKVLGIKSDWNEDGENLGYDVIGIEDEKTGLVYAIPENVITTISSSE